MTQYGNMYITHTEDCCENEGGYYCQVYADEDLNYERGDFCIHKEQIDLVPVPEFWEMAFACGVFVTVWDALEEYKENHK